MRVALLWALLASSTVGAGGLVSWFFKSFSSHSSVPTAPAAFPLPIDTSGARWGEYLWPTDAGRKRTSDFAEFRATHFHAGFDVSTGNQKGFKVFASRVGWVHAIQFQPGGYGWIVTLRHPGGWFTTYGHLDHVSDRLSAAYHARLTASGHSYGDAFWGEGDVPVVRGEIIAYTGESGAGPPHLHFEVRNPSFDPVHPGFARDLRTRDTIPPEFMQLCYMPLDASSSVDGRYAPRVLTLRRSGAGAWSSDERPVLRGRVGVLVRAHDRATDATDYPTPYRLRLLVDGAPRFVSTCAGFEDTLGFSIRIDRDHWMMQKSQGEFRKLYREKGNRLPFYRSSDPGDGVLVDHTVVPGTRKLTIVAEDIAGNSVTASAFCVMAADVHLGAWSSGGGAWTLKLPDTAHVASLRIETQTGAGWQEIKAWKSGELLRGVTVPASMLSGGVSRVVSTDAAGVTTTQMFLSPHADRSDAPLSVSRTIVFDEIVYTLHAAAPFAQPPVAEIRQGSRSALAEMISQRPDEYRVVFKTWQGFDGEAGVRIRCRTGAEERSWRDTLRATCVDPVEGGRVVSRDGGCTLRFLPGDVYRPMLVWIAGATGDSVRTYQAMPDDVPIPGRPLVTFTRSGSARAYLTAPRPVRKYGDAGDPTGRTVSARFGRFLGRYSLRMDGTAPQITLAGAGRGVLRFRIEDAGAGVDAGSIVVRSGGAVVPVELNEGSHVYSVPPDMRQMLASGEAVISVSDLLGSRATRAVSLTAPPPPEKKQAARSKSGTAKKGTRKHKRAH
jgi:murein DD-endopeptidase MepM/ murein hydrolase activator NlpD